MGLFKKKPSVDPAEFASLRTELSEMRTRLEAAEAAKAELTDRLGRMDATAVSHASNAVAGADAATEHLAALQARVEAAETAGAQVADLRARVEAAEQVAEMQARIAELDGGGNRRAELDQLAELPGQLAELSQQVARTAADASTAREQAAALEARLAQVSTELANQVAELGREMDSRPLEPAASTADVVVEQLREGQVRLANEQARYEIAFREDLATLAEQVRLLRGR